MKTSQLKSFFAFLVLAMLAFTSCKKDNPTPADPIVGEWVGKYGGGNDDPSTYYHLRILPNGIMKVIDEENKVTGTGTWELSETNLIVVYTYEQGGTFNIAAKFFKEQNKITGSWGYGDTDANAGDFYLDKQ